MVGRSSDGFFVSGGAISKQLTSVRYWSRRFISAVLIVTVCSVGASVIVVVVMQLAGLSEPLLTINIAESTL